MSSLMVLAMLAIKRGWYGYTDGYRSPADAANTLSALMYRGYVQVRGDELVLTKLGETKMLEVEWKYKNEVPKMVRRRFESDLGEVAKGRSAA